MTSPWLDIVPGWCENDSGSLAQLWESRARGRDIHAVVSNVNGLAEIEEGVTIRGQIFDSAPRPHLAPSESADLPAFATV
jgi:hypothetical protein